MTDRLEFQGKLGWLLEEAKKNNNRIQKEEVEKYFEEDGLDDEQMELVYGYLLSQKVAVSGYERALGKVKEETKEEKTVTPEEETYLRKYEKELEAYSGKDDLISRCMVKVPEIAKEVYDGTVFLGDLIQEGNVSLMLALQETENEEKILEAIQMGMEAFEAQQTDVHVRDQKMVEKVDELDSQIKKLKEEMGRKITLEELALYTEKSEAEIKSILKLAGEEVEE
nr:hypothetical protein [uncultured Sellimonas sp.]